MLRDDLFGSVAKLTVKFEPSIVAVYVSFSLLAVSVVFVVLAVVTLLFTYFCVLTSTF